MMKHCGDYSETYYDSGEYEGVDEKRKKFKFLKLKIELGILRRLDRMMNFYLILVE